MDLRTYRRGTPIGERVAKMLEEADVRGRVPGLRRRCVHGVVPLLQRRQRRSAYAGLAGRPAVQQPDQVRVEGIPEHFYAVYMAYHKKHVHSRAVADFIDFVKAYPCNDLIC